MSSSVSVESAALLNGHRLFLSLAINFLQCFSFDGTSNHEEHTLQRQVKRSSVPVR